MRFFVTMQMPLPMMPNLLVNRAFATAYDANLMNYRMWCNFFNYGNATAYDANFIFNWALAAVWMIYWEISTFRWILDEFD